MAERLPFKSSDFLRGLRVANQSALAGIIDACSQDSPKAVRDSISRGGGGINCYFSSIERTFRPCRLRLCKGAESSGSVVSRRF